jgi:hypothetical protein
MDEDFSQFAEHLLEEPIRGELHRLLNTSPHSLTSSHYSKT